MVRIVEMIALKRRTPLYQDLFRAAGIDMRVKLRSVATATKAKRSFTFSRAIDAIHSQVHPNYPYYSKLSMINKFRDKTAAHPADARMSPPVRRTGKGARRVSAIPAADMGASRASIGSLMKS